jgi:hypothetical protein
MTVPPWRTRSSRTIYQNPWLRLREDLVELPSGRTTIYGVVSTGSCVGVLPFLDPDTVVLVRQYRYVAGRHTWEMPTGGVAPGEPIQEPPSASWPRRAATGRAGWNRCASTTPPRASWTRPRICSSAST